MDITAKTAIATLLVTIALSVGGTYASTANRITTLEVTVQNHDKAIDETHVDMRELRSLVKDSQLVVTGAAARTAEQITSLQKITSTLVETNSQLSVHVARLEERTNH